MTQLGEAVFVAVIPEGKADCPFCESKKTPKKKPPLTITNDSKKLAKNLTAKPEIKIADPSPSNEPIDVVINDGYWISERRSKLGQNAHHVIPGNASLAEAVGLLGWFADKVKIEKRWYLREDPGQVGVIRRRSGKEGDVKFTATRTVDKITDSGAKIIDRKTISGNKVYDKVEYDINCAENGIWLPSNDAIASWSGQSEEYRQLYAERAMIASGVQFHDSHPQYSESVLSELKEIQHKADKRAQQCLRHKDSDTKPWPAPQKLANVLKQLSLKIAKTYLHGKPGKKFNEDWLTSRFAEDFKFPK